MTISSAGLRGYCVALCQDRSQGSGIIAPSASNQDGPNDLSKSSATLPLGCFRPPFLRDKILQ